LSTIPPTIVQSVYDTIRAAIVNGEMKPGDPLVEATLSERFGISKTPVREALIRLRRDGLVESAPHRVTRVVTPTVGDIRQACQLREWIETRICATCAERPSDALLAGLRESIQTAERALAESDGAAYGESIRRFTDQLLASSDNHFAVQALQRLRNILDLIGNISRGAPGRHARSIDEHRAILAAVEARDPERAAAAVSAHLHSIARDCEDAVHVLVAQPDS
jgi:GntR family transcriptional regulator, rspAB operon transcriptional repressor